MRLTSMIQSPCADLQGSGIETVSPDAHSGVTAEPGDGKVFIRFIKFAFEQPDGAARSRRHSALVARTAGAGAGLPVSSAKTVNRKRVSRPASCLDGGGATAVPMADDLLMVPQEAVWQGRGLAWRSGPDICLPFVAQQSITDSFTKNAISCNQKISGARGFRLMSEPSRAGQQEQKARHFGFRNRERGPQPPGRSFTQVTGATHSTGTFCSIGVAEFTETNVTSPATLPASTIFTSWRPSLVWTTHSRP